MEVQMLLKPKSIVAERPRGGEEAGIPCSGQGAIY
jgi:hypothetical protein